MGPASLRRAPPPATSALRRDARHRALRSTLPDAVVLCGRRSRCRRRRGLVRSRDCVRASCPTKRRPLRGMPRAPAACDRATRQPRRVHHRRRLDPLVWLDLDQLQREEWASSHAARAAAARRARRRAARLDCPGAAHVARWLDDAARRRRRALRRACASTRWRSTSSSTPRLPHFVAEGTAGKPACCSPAFPLRARRDRARAHLNASTSVDPRTRCRTP
jgi:hypothetical protein